MKKIILKDWFSYNATPTIDETIVVKINEIIDWINDLDSRFNKAKQQLDKINNNMKD